MSLQLSVLPKRTDSPFWSWYSILLGVKVFFFFNENLGCFQVLATMCRAALNTGRLISAQCADVITFGTLSGRGLALYGVVAFSVTHPALYCLSLCGRLPFLAILPNPFYPCSFWLLTTWRSYATQFMLTDLKLNDTSHFFMHFLWHVFVFGCEISFIHLKSECIFITQFSY